MARLHMKNGRYKEAVEDLNLVTQLEPGIELAPVLAEAYGKMGDWYKDQEKLQEAVSAYNRAANLQPANGAIHYKLGISLLALGRTGDAEKVLERASALQADITPEKGAAETFRSKARHLLTDGKTADAAQCLLLAELIDPSIDVSRARAELFQQQGKQLWDDGKKRKALELYIKAKRMYETLPGLDEDMARAMGEVGDRREAIALYEKLLARNPGDREWLESVGKLYMQSGDYKSALEKFSLLGEHGDTMVVKMLLNLAADAEDAGDWQRASQLYEEALERRPEDVELKLKYYSAMSARGRYDTAVEGMKELLKKYPEPRRPTFILLSIRKLENVRPGENLESSNGHHTWSFSPLWEGGVSLGKFTINRGKPVFSQGSVSRWERPSATRISYSGPDPIHDPFSLILTYDGGKEVEIFFPQIGSSKSLFADTEGNTYYDGSLADIARTAFPREIPPYLTIHYRMGMMYSAAGKRDESFQFARYHCKWGEAYLRLGMYRNSEIELKRALEIRPDLFEGYMGLGNLYSREGRYGEELKAMEKAVGMKPEDPVALNNLGVAYADTGQYKMAEREFLKSIDEDVNYLIAYWNLVKLYELQGREADKRFWMKQARKPRRVDPCEEGMTIKR
jgi:tetratricopeptide (TPR) repeat protein